VFTFKSNEFDFIRFGSISISSNSLKFYFILFDLKSQNLGRFEKDLCNYLREANSALSLFLSSVFRFFEKQRPNDYDYQYIELISEPLISDNLTKLFCETFHSINLSIA
jgi:hypothetical protein